jgi:hypothetical protein
VYNYDPIVVTTCAPGLPLTNGLVFCRIKSWLTGRRFVSLPFSDHCDALVDGADQLDEILVDMQRRVDESGWQYVEIRPSSCEPTHHTGYGKKLTYYVHRLDLRGSIERLFCSFHVDCVQRTIRRAGREKLRCEEGTSEALLQDFYRLLVLTRRRQFLPPQPIAWFRGLVSSFATGLKIRVAYKSSKPVSAILTLTHNRSMVYKYGCSNARFNSYGGMALLFWNAIQEAKDHGCEEFDMGRSDIENRGLIAFKQHWAARQAELSYWTYPHAPRSQSVVWQRRILRGFVAVSPDLALKTVGNVFYKHIG